MTYNVFSGTLNLTQLSNIRIQTFLNTAQSRALFMSAGFNVCSFISRLVLLCGLVKIDDDAPQILLNVCVVGSHCSRMIHAGWAHGGSDFWH